MKMLTETIINLFDLIEAEGRLFKHKLIQTLVVVLLIFGAATMLMVTMGFLVTALYHALLNILPMYAVFLSMALLSILMSGGILWIAIKVSKRP